MSFDTEAKAIHMIEMEMDTMLVYHLSIHYQLVKLVLGRFFISHSVRWYNIQL